MRKHTTGDPGAELEKLAFASFHLKPDGALFRGEQAIHLSAKELQALRLLLEHAGNVVSPAQLRTALWGDEPVAANSVARCISSLRARLEPDDCIQTIYKRGYRLTAPVQRQAESAQTPLLRLAVCPFETAMNVPQHLGCAVMEEAIAGLTGAGLAGFAILARESAQSLHNRGLGPVEIGRAMRADLLLTGRIAALASHYRLQARMIRVEDGAEIWVEELIASQKETGGLEAELIQRVLSRLGSPGLALAASAGVLPGDTAQRREAWDCYQRGRYEWRTQSRHRIQDGMRLLLNAVELDPGLLAARVELVHLLVMQAIFGFMPPGAAGDLILRTIEQTPNLDTEGGALLPALAWVRHNLDRDLPGALTALRASSHPGYDPFATRMRILLALGRHRFDEAMALSQEALRADPFSPWLHNRMAWTLHLAGQAEASVECARQAIAQFPGHLGSILFGVAILASHGHAEQALELAAAMAGYQPAVDASIAIHAYALARAGRREEARATMERLQWLSNERYVLSAFSPAAWLALGETENALADLERRNELRCAWFLQMLADPRLRPLHGHPRFEALRSAWQRMEEEAALSGEEGAALPGS